MTQDPLLLKKIQHLLKAYYEAGVTLTTGTVPRSLYERSQKAPPAIFTDSSPSSQPMGVLPMKKKINSSSLSLAKQCQSLEELRQAMQHFDECALKFTATNMVFSDGNPNTRLMLIGEAPGAEEDAQGKPFVGLSGQLLNRILATIGLDRQTDVYITNIVPWRPPANRQPTPSEIAQCLPFVQRHIELIQPEILLLVGGVSAKTILETTEGIMRLRGQWNTYQSEGLSTPIRCMATFHPAFLLRSPGQKALVWQDMLLIQEALKQKKKGA